MADNVNHPSHYTSGDIECIDAIRAALGPERFIGYLWGNAIKYLWRWPRKGQREDLEKCAWYITRIKDENYDGPSSCGDSENKKVSARWKERALRLMRGQNEKKGGKL